MSTASTPSTAALTSTAAAPKATRIMLADNARALRNERVRLLPNACMGNLQDGPRGRRRDGLGLPHPPEQARGYPPSLVLPPSTPADDSHVLWNAKVDGPRTPFGTQRWWP